MDTKSKIRDVLFVLLFAPFLCHPTCKLVKITLKSPEKPSFFWLKQLYCYLNIIKLKFPSLQSCRAPGSLSSIFISYLYIQYCHTWIMLKIHNNTLFDLASLSENCFIDSGDSVAFLFLDFPLYFYLTHVTEGEENSIFKLP